MRGTVHETGYSRDYFFPLPPRPWIVPKSAAVREISRSRAIVRPAPDPGAPWIFVGLAKGERVAETPLGKKKDPTLGATDHAPAPRWKSQRLQALANFSDKPVAARRRLFATLGDCTMRQSRRNCDQSKVKRSGLTS